MKKLLFISLTILSIICLTSCQTNDYGKKDDKPTMEDKEKPPVKEEDKTPVKEEDKTPVKEEEDKTPVKEEDKTPVKNPVLYENEAFKITSIIKEETVNNVMIVEGQARVFEANFQYRLEDGHNVLAEGNQMADIGAPEWGNFKLRISHHQPSSPNGVLTIYESSAKDGQPIHVLNIPVQFSNYE